MITRLREWVGAGALGAWLGVAAVWPVAAVPIGKTTLLWQPLLLVSLLALAIAQARRVGRDAAAAQSLWLYAMMTLAAWLPIIRTIPSIPNFSYPHAYTYYLSLYEAILSALVGFQGFVALSGQAPACWPAGRWSRPLIVAPILLMVRAIAPGHWMAPLGGLVVGMTLASFRPWRLVPPSWNTLWRWVPWGLVLCAALITFGAGMRIYQQTGAQFPLDSDDGPLYYAAALRIAKEPLWALTSPEADLNFFSAYPVVMGWWFGLVGPHVLSWLLWQGVATGVLALAVYRLGRLVGGPLVGVVSAGLVVMDHVMLHLMATLNMEVGLIPALYVAVWLWSSVSDQPPSAQGWRRFLAGLMLGLATLFRPTAALFPVALGAALFVERPKRSWRDVRRQAGWMLAGFGVPIGLLLIRHRFAWGYWTLGTSQGSLLSWRANYAWEIHGQHPYAIGVGPWLQLVVSDPAVIWREILPDWWQQILSLWTHRGFGQMDLVQGLNYPGSYQAALAGILTVGVVTGILVAIRRRTRGDLALVSLPVYFTSLALVWYVINTRYRAPFIPALYLLCCAGWSAIAAAIRARATASPGRVTAPVLSRQFASVP